MPPRAPAGTKAPPLGQLGPWQLVYVAGEGSLAKVYRARPASGFAEGSGDYAVKVLRERWGDDPIAKSLFAREALVGRQVSHRHLVSVLAANLGRPPCYLVMPWLAGSSLADVLKGDEPLDMPTALWIVRQVAEALLALDTAGWMHGDVKPSNIFVSPQGHVTLLDLGFARRSGENESVINRCVAGTLAYMAPEKLTSLLLGDVRSDIYSLGIVLYELLTGRRPFTGRTPEELVYQQRQTAAVDVRRVAPHVPLDAARLVHGMLSKEPLRRPQSPAELIGRLIALEVSALATRD